jgi:hypothetical protein
VQAERPLIWVERGSLEYNLFVHRLDENQFEKKVKKSVCVACWSFISTQEKLIHPEHRDFVLPPGTIKNEASFLQLASEYKKVDGFMVAILNSKPILTES